MELAFNLDGGLAIVALLGAVGAALIAGGAVLYRGTDQIGFRALAAAAVAAGAVVWAFILYVTPVAVTRGG